MMTAQDHPIHTGARTPGSAEGERDPAEQSDGQGATATAPELNRERDVDDPEAEDATDPSKD